MIEAVPYEIRQALGMPEADLAEACERIRTMRQTEMFAEHLHRSGRLASNAVPAGSPRKIVAFLARLALAAPTAMFLTALFLALALGWVALVDRPQESTWAVQVQAPSHPHPDVEQLLRIERRQRAALNP